MLFVTQVAYENCVAVRANLYYNQSIHLGNFTRVAIFKNKEGDLPPLIPVTRSKQESLQVQKTDRQPVKVPDFAAPDLQQSPEAVPAQTFPLTPQDELQPQAPMPTQAPTEIAAPVVPQQLAVELPPVPSAPVEQPPVGPQFDTQIDQVQRPESLENSITQLQQPQEGEQPKRKRTRKQQDDQGVQLQPEVPTIPESKTPERMEIESILSGGVSDLYKAMTPDQQQVFRLKGDETAKNIETMVHSLKATTRKVVGLIREWLQTIPGVNKYFVEQESKLKTDEIMKYQRKVKKDRQSRITL